MLTHKDKSTVLHVLWGMHAAGIENFALQLVAFTPPNVKSILLNLDPKSLDLYSSFQTLVQRNKLEKIIPMAATGPFLSLKIIVYCLFNQIDCALIYPCDSRLIWLILGLRLSFVPSISVCVQNTAPTDKFKKLKWQLVLYTMHLLRVSLVSCSNSVAQSIRPLLPTSISLPVIPNGVNLDLITSKLSSNSPVDSKNHLINVIMVARLDIIKDQITLIRAFSMIAVQGCNLVLVGDGPLRSTLEQVVSELNLDNSVHFLGKRLDITELLASSDIFAFSTTASEGFGIALIEAMAVGLPIIASDVPACREVLADGSAGQLIPAGNAEAWAYSLNQLINSRTKREYWSSAAKNHSKLYDIKSSARLWYSHLLN